MVTFDLFFWPFFFEKSHSPCRKKKENKLKTKKEKKNKKEKLGPTFDTKEGIFGPIFDSTAYVYNII